MYVIYCKPSCICKCLHDLFFSLQSWWSSSIYKSEEKQDIHSEARNWVSRSRNLGHEKCQGNKAPWTHDLPVIYVQGKSALKEDIRFLVLFHFNSFTANVADRRRHSRLPTSPIGDFEAPLQPCLKSLIFRHSVVVLIKVLTLMTPIWDNNEMILKVKTEKVRFPGMLKLHMAICPYLG